MIDRLRQPLAAAVAALANWRFFKPAVFLACLAPGVWLGYHAWRFFIGGDFMALGVDPSITLLHETGKTALILLLVTLSITPVRRLLGVNRLQAVRRMLGVWSFTYAAIHVSLYLTLDQLCYSLATCEFAAIWEDVLKRRFIFVGALAFVILLLLALTSTTGWMRRLKRNWQRLHRLVYVAAIAAVIHFIWIQKSDIREPLNWAIWLAVVLGIRIVFAIQKRRRARERLPVTA
ncbi:MAG TPA: protein-methionine-sulfoxide reductase heme-binding subunit MsrQ [Vicinamibacterales bacterium]|nr:protein-methionine-sulfoxide reductase heme-binding subunit MsrQ [Vicinamibacterales bacterium]